MGIHTLTKSEKHNPALEYHPRTVNVLQRIFKDHFDEFEEEYAEKYADLLGEYRIFRFKKVVERFIYCGDYTQGIARVHCDECGHDLFLPFSCKGFFLCPSCGQKRTLMFAEHLTDDVLLNVPHKQYVFTFPKRIRPYFRKNWDLFSDMSNLIYEMMETFYDEAVGVKVLTGAVISYQTFGNNLRWNPHFHAIFIEGGFDREGKFMFVPMTDTKKLGEYFREKVLGYFMDKGILPESDGERMLNWEHSGFSINNATRIYVSNGKLKENMSEYIVRAPISLQKIIYEPARGKVIVHTKYNPWYKENMKVMDADDFIALALQHVPPKGKHLTRYYGLYSSRTRWKWEETEFLEKIFPAGFKGRLKEKGKLTDKGEGNENKLETERVTLKRRNRAWRRLISKIYEIDPMICEKCGAEMRIQAAITAPEQVRKILKHLIKIGRPPPGIENYQLDG